MLPDFRDLKLKIGPKIASSIKNEAQSGSLLSQVRTHRIHEGNRFTLVRIDGSSETSEFRKIEASVEITVDEIRNSGLEAISRARRQMAEQFEAAASRHFIETIHRTTEEVGNVVDAGGKPLTAELILEMFRKVEFTFSAEGVWQRPQFILHPEMFQRARKEFERLEEDSEIKANLDAIIEEKRREWRVREADRKLVD